MRQLVVDYGVVFNRVALMEKDELQEIYIEDTLSKSLVGNIYLGRVVNVVESISAVFIDIGQEKNAYLQIKAGEKISGEILVQVKKDPLGDKGATLTRDLSISGTYGVLLPLSETVLVSKKIQASDQRLAAIKDHLKGMGCVLRTESAQQALPVILEEFSVLMARWVEIEKANRRIVKTPLIYEDFGFEALIQKDFLPLVEQLVINDPQKVAYFKHPSILVHEGPQSIFEAYGVDRQIGASLKRSVTLHQGSYITIDETEALTAIDVNSGHYIGTHNKEETFLQVNLAAAKEIAKQVRLRNISGIIVIDFINMKSKLNYDHLIKNLNKHFKKDRSKVITHGVTQLGLVEVTRKKNRKSLKNQLMTPCDVCSGGGWVQSFNIHFKRLEDKIKTLMVHTSETAFVVNVSHEMYGLLHLESPLKVTYLQRLEEGLGVTLEVNPLDDLGPYECQTSLDKRKA